MTEVAPPEPRPARWTTTFLPMLPALVVLITLGVVGFVYRDALSGWFGGPAGVDHTAHEAATRSGGGHSGHGGAAGAPSSPALEDPKAVAWYTCPMHSSIRAKVPGQCPLCGMDLVPITQGDLTSGTIHVDDDSRRRIGVVVEPVRRSPVTVRVVAPGVTAFAEDGLVDIAVRAAGWILRIDVGSVGERVRRGQPLVEIKSPEISSAAAEYFAVVKTARSDQDGLLGTASLARAARARLKLLGLDDDDIKAFSKARGDGTLVLQSPLDGVVVMKEGVEGGPVGMGMPILRLARTDPLWVNVQVAEPDAGLVAEMLGSPVEVRFLIAGGPEVEGVVALVGPAIDPEMRTLSVRVHVPNPQGTLLAGLTAEVTFVERRPDALTVPADAVIFAGARRLVFVDLGQGRLRPVPVTLGVRDGERYSIVSGLDEFAQVVTSGVFLLSAESRLKTAGGDASPW